MLYFMTSEKWQQIVGNIKDNYEVEECEKRYLEEQGGVEVEYIIFKGPLGRMKLEFITKPAVIDKKTKYSNRLGAETVVEYVYSPKEKSHKLKAYKWDEAINDWLEMEAKKFDI
ncbi:hypothetical protein A3H66_02070 [Candidatus Falkowbacteria bacterium RIFCSPLOWO2_02_FULL_45_21]|uniref:Uncharacterized protein n=1 Tax=Candidatus Falkowbacteria bacterium RIFCSPLOWO2_02_FULL_45_21 TaxID=1797989 RepID=A0A1F5SC90_9BACT|nr:MAG: hypothetical protein A3H66_02070 [Candidatus Falkowbacteria bacterium RIFCSPLOWO2_02_FULL_45_21]